MITNQVLSELLNKRLQMHSPRPGVAHKAQVEVVRVAGVLLVVDAHREAQDLGAQESAVEETEISIGQGIVRNDSVCYVDYGE